MASKASHGDADEGTLPFELYFALNAFTERLKLLSEPATIDKVSHHPNVESVFCIILQVQLKSGHTWFEPFVESWLTQTKRNIFDWIERAIKLDKVLLS